MIFKLTIYLTCAVCFIGCKEKKIDEVCELSKLYIFSKDLNKVFPTQKIRPQKSEYRDRGYDSIRGGYYIFDELNFLKEYFFFSTKEVYTYHEIFDKDSGVNVQGNPIVFNKVDRITIDSFNVIKYISAINKVYDSLYIKSNTGKMISAKLYKDTIYSNMLSASFGYNFQNQDEIVLYSSIHQTDRCFNKSQIIRDTIRIFYNQNVVNNLNR